MANEKDKALKDAAYFIKDQMVGMDYEPSIEEAKELLEKIEKALGSKA